MVATRFGDPADRLLLNENLAAADDASARARQWSEYAIAALEYAMNASYSQRHALYAAVTPNQLTDFLGDLSRAYEDATAWQTNVGVQRTVVSVRRDILGIRDTIVDDVTGIELTPQAQFRRYVLSPGSWDARGRLKVWFSTMPRGESSVFSRNVYNDRVAGIAVNLVGDVGARNAHIIIQHTGLNALRTSGANEEYIIYRIADHGTDNAQIEVLVNGDLLRDLPGGSSSLRTGAFNHRSVLAESWRLLFDPDDGQNVTVDLTGLDDIEILFEHEYQTLDD